MGQGNQIIQAFIRVLYGFLGNEAVSVLTIEGRSGGYPAIDFMYFLHPIHHSQKY